MGKARGRSLAATEIIPEQGGRIREPNNNDVLCGRGGRINAHQGNIQFRLLVSEHKHLYLAKTTKKLDKAHIATLVVSKVRQLSPPGCFLKEDGSSGLWIEIGDVKARKKAGQALREDAPDLRNKSDGEESPISSPVARSPSGMPPGPMQWEQPQHPFQHLDSNTGNLHQFPNIPPQMYRMPISEGSTVLHGYNKYPRREMPHFSTQHTNQENYYSNPVPAYYPTHTPASMHTSNQLQSVLVPQQAFQKGPHHIVTPSETHKNQDYGTHETDSTSNASFDSHVLSRMAKIIASPKILSCRRKPNKLQPDNNDEKKSFSMRAEWREKFHRPRWKNGKSIEFPHLEAGVAKDDSNGSPRPKMGQCGSSNETFNSSITSSGFRNSNISDLSTSRATQGLTRSFSFPPSALLKSDKSIEFPPLEAGIAKDDSNGTFSCTENENVANSTRPRMGQCGSSNDTFNSSLTSSCFRNGNMSDLSTSFAASGVTRSLSFPPSALTDASFAALVEYTFPTDDSNRHTSSSSSNRMSTNLGNSDKSNSSSESWLKPFKGMQSINSDMSPWSRESSRSMSDVSNDVIMMDSYHRSPTP